MTYVNDNRCVCGHTKYEHVLNSKFETKWCSFNQKSCDCWEYKAQPVDRREFVTDIKIEIVKGF
jgi:hypothetical protein